MTENKYKKGKNQYDIKYKIQEMEQLNNSLKIINHMTVNRIYENITARVNTAIGNNCQNQKEQKLNHKTRTLVKQRREITDKTTAEYRNINKEIIKEMRKHKREKNAGDIIEENRNLKVLR